MPADDLPIDLVHLITKLELGGAQLATLYEIEHSRVATGRRCLLFGSGGMLEREAHSLPGVECVEVPELVRDISPSLDGRALVRVARLLRSLRCPDRRLVVHTHSSKAGIVGRWAARIAGADLVVHSIHGFGHHPWQSASKYLPLLMAEQATAHLTDGFTGDSEANLLRGRDEAILGSIPARVIRCGIDVGQFATPVRRAGEVRAELHIAAAAPVVLGVSCLKPQKDPLAMVEVARLVIEQCPDVVFLLAGDGELRPRVESRIRQAGIDGAFRLLGWRRDIPDLMDACDVVVNTSRWEGLPQTFAQAMAAGRPIVATNVDGAREAIVHRQNGFVFGVGEIKAMADGIIALLHDPDGRRRMGQEGRKHAEQFSQERMVTDLDNFYWELLDSHRPIGRARLLAQMRHWWAWLRRGA